MAPPLFSIGIDLGTTNSAMAFAPLTPDAASEVFLVPQWDTAATLVEHATLPSFLYLPEAGAADLPGVASPGRTWIIGLFARKKAHELPGRVAHSAKSWLCHHAADREAAFLPWGSEDVPPADKISPVRAASLILDYLRSGWNDRFAARGPDWAFDAQDITIAVPASFDAAAQRLTLTAAEQAGYPDTVRLLEEPQAAFYSWLERHDPARDLWSGLPSEAAECCHVLVVDVGGGTSDFSLFEVRPGTAAPKIKRVAVGEHILLGGDNVDLALAHLLEPRLVGADGKLAAASWDDLVARCRDIKETALSGQGTRDEAFAVSLPGRGASLVARALAARLTRADIEQVVLDGFFPPCEADVRVRRTHAALKEWGLPYAIDSAITRHLAAFLQGRSRVDAVLFNGGALYPEPVRDRIRRLIGEWFGSPPPLALVNAEPDLAVARGAAHFGRLIHCRGERIEAGAARAVFIEIHRKPEEGAQPSPSLVCILPRGAAPEESFEITDLSLRLRVNRRVSFQTYASPRHGRCRVGDIVPGTDSDLHALPPLQTIARLDDATGDEAGRTLPVTLTAKLSELGLLQVACRSAEPGIRRSWPLDFDLRLHRQDDQDAWATPAAGAAPPPPNAAPEALAEARRRVQAAFEQAPDGRSKLTAARLLQSLEKILQSPKGDWNWVLVRALWPPLAACSHHRRLSVDHEEAWLILAGFLLRPGFGADGDESRMDTLWSTHESGLCFPGKRIRLQEYILWRRVAGGLSRERQQAVLSPELAKLRAPKSAAPELVLLAGSLERLDQAVKTELIEGFVAAAADLARRGGHATPYLAALGLLLNRAPLYAGPETVVSPKLVELAYEALFRLDWAPSELSELHTVFLRAARVVDNRSLDVGPALRGRIADKLEKMGVAPLKTAKLRAFVPVTTSERPGLFGERLPPGLVLAEPRP